MSRSSTQVSRVRRERRDYRVLLAVSFPAFLVAATVRRVAGLDGDTGGRRSLFAEARALADSTIPFAFMG